METERKKYRKVLPSPMYQGEHNVWSALKYCIGSDLSKIAMPVLFNEPLSFLQRIAEYMEYSHLLRIAAQESDPVQRIQYVAGFAISALTSNSERLGKPFNPLLGETYELEREDFRFVSEQVSHHPPVSAFHAQSPDWVFFGSVYPKIKFWGKSLEIQPIGILTIEFPKHNEAYTWSNVDCCVHNVVVGRLWIEQYGTMEIVNHTTGHVAQINFKQASHSKDAHRVEGFVMDKSKQKLLYIYGKWTEFIKCADQTAYEEYSKKNPHKFKKDEKSKSPHDSPSHTSRKVLQKLNSLKVSSLKSTSTQESVDEGASTDQSESKAAKNDNTIDIPNSIMIWKVNRRPLVCSEYYQFTEFAMSLNEMEAGMKKRLCPTDSRLRPDIRALEHGDTDSAAITKLQLEERQRERRGNAKKGEKHQPRWFFRGMHPHSKQEDWIFNGKYWNREYANKYKVDIFNWKEC